ncbi:MAG: hypothetical protein IPO83_06350 [Chitinophagaceae bacterium]|nr:hypothetical protein [Chitinophagaceae bacterium]
MKSFKTPLLAVFFTLVLALVDQQLSVIPANAVGSLRVRTVPSSTSTEQKKKEVTTPEATPKTPESSNTKSSSALNCNDANQMKMRLAVLDGGSPK